jgi:hypothetical protein
MNRKYLSLLTLPLIATGVAYADSEHRLSSYAEAAEVEISPIPRDRRLISLPDLEFAMRIDASCVGETQAQSISISVADSVAAHDVSAQEGGPTDKVMLETTFKVSGRQIAPIAIEDFCVSGDDSDTAARTLLIPAAVAANISLRCTSENSQSVRYDRLPLQIQLICAPADDPTDGQKPNAD